MGSRDLTEWRTPLDRLLLRIHHRAADRVGSRRALGAELVVGAVVAVASTWLSTGIYGAVTDRDGVAALDRPALRLAMRCRTPLTDGVAAVIARVFGPVGMPIGTGAAALALSRADRSRGPAVLLATAAAGSLAMTLGGKDVVKRHRPPHRDAIPPYETSPSFPSGHTLNASVLVGLLAYLLMLRQRRRGSQVATASGAAVTVVAVGASRILLGAHWLTDVLVAFALGSGWLGTLVTVDRIRLTEEAGRAGLSAA